MIAFDAKSEANTTGTSSTWSHTCTGSNRILFVGVGTDFSGDVVTGVTYNGVAMTQVNKQATTGANNYYAYVYMLVNPDSGAHDIVVSASGSYNLRTAAASYTGALQTGQPDATNKATSNTTEQSVSVTVVAANSWIFAIGQAKAAIPAAGTGITSRTSSLNIRIGDSNAGLSAGANSISFTRSPADDIGVIAVSFSPAPETANRNYAVFLEV